MATAKYVVLDPQYRFFFHRLLRNADECMPYRDDTASFKRIYDGSIFFSEGIVSDLLLDCSSNQKTGLRADILDMNTLRWEANNFHTNVTLTFAACKLGSGTFYELVQMTSGLWKYTFQRRGDTTLHVIAKRELVDD